MDRSVHVDGQPSIALLRRLLAEAPDHDAVVLEGESRLNQLAAVALRRLRSSVPLVIEDCTWGPGVSRLDRFLSTAGARAMDGPLTHYCVLTAAEQRMFQENWRVPADRVHHTPWYHGLTLEQLRAPVRDGGFVFSGGDSLRDYMPLIEAARELPDMQLRVGARRPPPIPRDELTPNVDFRSLPRTEYERSMRDSSAVVVALAKTTRRSAGQNNYLNPMALGKLVIVTDGVGVREYIEDRRTGLVVEAGNPRALTEALRWALDPANQAECRAIAERGREDVLTRFSPDAYVGRLLDVVDEAVGRRDPAAAQPQ